MVHRTFKEVQLSDGFKVTVRLNGSLQSAACGEVVPVEGTPRLRFTSQKWPVSEEVKGNAVLVAAIRRVEELERELEKSRQEVSSMRKLCESFAQSITGVGPVEHKGTLDIKTGRYTGSGFFSAPAKWKKEKSPRGVEHASDCAAVFSTGVIPGKCDCLGPDEDDDEE